KVRSSHGAYVKNIDHDEAGHVVRTDYGNGTVDTLGYYDASGRSPLGGAAGPGSAYKVYSSTTSAGDGSTLRSLTYGGYDAVGKIGPTTDANPRGLPGDTSVSQTATYDALSRLQTSDQVGGATATRSGAYTYDSYGRITSKDRLSYNYDPNRSYQLTTVG